MNAIIDFLYEVRPKNWFEKCYIANILLVAVVLGLSPSENKLTVVLLVFFMIVNYLNGQGYQNALKIAKTANDGWAEAISQLKQLMTENGALRGQLKASVCLKCKEKLTN